MMLKPVDEYFLAKDEPLREYLLFIRQHIMNFDPAITEALKYGMPFYHYQGRRFCYIWVNKKTGHPYIGFTDGNLIHHEKLEQEKRTRMKVLPLNAAEKVPVKLIDQLLQKAIKVLDRF